MAVTGSVVCATMKSITFVVAFYQQKSTVGLLGGTKDKSKYSFHRPRLSHDEMLQTHFGAVLPLIRFVGSRHQKCRKGKGATWRISISKRMRAGTAPTGHSASLILDFLCGLASEATRRLQRKAPQGSRPRQRLARDAEWGSLAALCLCLVLKTPSSFLQCQRCRRETCKPSRSTPPPCASPGAPPARSSSTESIRDTR